jgi:hypothetical protein
MAVNSYTESTDNGFLIQVQSDGTIRAATKRNTTQAATTTATISTGVWSLLTAIFTTGSSRSVFLNGGNKVTDNGSLAAPLSIDRTVIGAQFDDSSSAYDSFTNGAIAHVAIWDAALTDAEIASLYNDGIGLDPRQMRPDVLAAYWPLLDDDDDVDWWGQYDLTPSGSPTYAAGPPLLMPSGIISVVQAAGAPPAGDALPMAMQQYRQARV